MAKKRLGLSYKKKVADINRIYDAHAKDGLSNREIWRRYIYPIYAISERTLYNILGASYEPHNIIPAEQLSLFDFTEQKK